MENQQSSTHIKAEELDNPEGVKQPKFKVSDEDNENEASVSFCGLFRFADNTDYVLMIVGTIAALASGAALPIFALLWGDATDAFNQGGDTMVDKAREVMFQFLYIGAAVFVAGWLMFACWMIAGERQAIKCRRAYFKSMLHQDIAWFDMRNQSQLASTFATDCFDFQGAIGEKISTILMTVGMFICGFVIAFIQGWKMSLVVLATLPVIAICGAIYLIIVENEEKVQSKNYRKAGGEAEQAISSIKTVKILNGQVHESTKFNLCLQQVSKKSMKYAILSGMGIGLLFFAMLSSYALGFWYGSNCAEANQHCPGEKYTPGSVITIFFSILMAGFNLSQVQPALKSISVGKQSARRIFFIIDRQPVVKNCDNPIIPKSFSGKIQFHNVTFAYPKQKSHKILDKINLDFECTSSALVGESGCGKSTILQLVLRFYDPDEGRVTLDGIDIKNIDLQWLRSNIGFVGQEPVLFATTIKENLLFGKSNASDAQIKEALIQAKAYDFVQNLDNKLDTYVGMGGGQLSGGQKQRIAIARALLTNPKILLLDEATSALDRRNQRLIQNTLNQISSNRTTITVAHRVKTIMHSNIIYVLSKGKIEESGSFSQLQRYKNIEIEKQEDIVQEVISNKNSDNNHLNGKDHKEQQPSQQEKSKDDEATQNYEGSVFGRLFSYSKDKKILFFIGILFALGNGTIFPLFSLFLSNMLLALQKLYLGTAGGREDADRNALIFFLLGVAAFILMTGQTAIFAIIGNDITMKVRKQAYFKILKMPVSWFDLPKKNAGALTARLSADCRKVNGLTTTFIAITIQNISTLVTGLIIAFIYEWRITLVALGFIPLMIIAGIVQMATSTGFSAKTDEAYKDSSDLIMESMVNIRTVQSFGYQNSISMKYNQKLQNPQKLAVKKGNIAGLLYGLSQIVLFIIFGLLFFIGSLFVRDIAQVNTLDLFTAIYAVVFAAMTAGNNAHFMPDVAAARNSAINLFEILDSKDEDQLQVQSGSKLLKSSIKGNIQIENLQFKYASRKDYIFQNLKLKIEEGSKVAFVGPSGCGKSTIIQLLLRFYDPSMGSINIDGQNIADYDIHHLRSHFGVVSQEPVLFNGSFAENIKYNLSDATENEIRDVATQANAISFIMGSEDQPNKNNGFDQGEGKGFDRNVGIKGSHISGGQKQRVAIARAILRKPQILMLDEATSALDSQNEKRVQKSLDSIMQGKTTISIAHRIDTIKNSDLIYVFQKGKIVEEGSYAALVKLQGHFYNLERGTQFT